MLSQIKARTRVVFNDAVNQELTFTIGPSEYVIRDIQGLGPVKADVSEIEDVSDRGSYYLSSRLGGRNIVMRIGFKPNYAANHTVTELRLALNKVFMPTNKVELDFYHEEYGIVRVTGYVESCEPVIFAKDPEVTISILCQEPYFTSTDPMYSYTLPGGTGTTFVINSDLDVPVGFIVDMDLTGNRAGGLSVTKQSPRLGDQYLQINTDLLTGDKLRFNTIKGQREVVLTRSAAEQNALGYFTGSLVDTKIEPGPNYWRINEISSLANVRFRWYKSYGSL